MYDKVEDIAFPADEERMLDAYKRYGHAPANFFANRFAQAVAGEAWFGRIYANGMAAITTAVEAIGLRTGGHIVAGQTLYGETPKNLNTLNTRFGVGLTYVDSGNVGEVIKAVQPMTCLILVESVGNGLDMPVLDFEALLRAFWSAPLTIMLDNTFCTCRLFNPFRVWDGLQEELGEPRVNFVYVESLSKFYRAGDRDDVNAGLVIASPRFIESCDAVMARFGTVISAQALQMLPANLAEPLERVVYSWLSGRHLAGWLREQPHFRQVKPEDRPVGGIIYAELDTDEVEVAIRFCDTLECPVAASFGHPITTILPLGAFGEGSPGVIRIAAGYEEDVEETKGKFERAFPVLQL